MSAAAVAVAVASGLAALVGTLWTKRRGGPDMVTAAQGYTTTAFESLQAQVETLTAQVETLKAEAETSKTRQLDLVGEVLAFRQALGVERVYVGMLVGAMRVAGIPVPERPSLEDIELPPEGISTSAEG